MARRAVQLLVLLSCISLATVVLNGSLDIAGFHATRAEEFPGVRNNVPHPQVHAPAPHSTSAETTIVGEQHVHGFTVFENLYVWNGTFFIVTSDPSVLPPRGDIISRPIKKGPGVDMEPTDEEMQYITPEQAQAIFQGHVLLVPGLSVFMTDAQQFMTHYYHWWGELILGAWRILCALQEQSDPFTVQPRFPDRFIVPHVDGSNWRDPAGVNAPMMRAAFASSTIEDAGYWKDLIKLNRTVVFETGMIINRSAAHKSSYSKQWFKMIAGTMGVSVPKNFWEPVRQFMLKNVLGFVPDLDEKGAVVAPEQVKSDIPIVTYVSRQGSRSRKLLSESHDSLVEALRGLEAEGICQVYVAKMEEMTVKNQLELVARSTVIVGVHGNGLTHELWMPPSPRSTVIEMFFPNAYVFDYEMLARNMGHRHYAAWNDSLITYPEGTYYDGINYGEESDFHGSSIPVHGPAVASVIRKRLTE